jgi:hypothetical protein
MARTIVAVCALAIMASSASAQTTPPASWPVCNLGAAPIAPGPAPAEAKVFPSQGGPVIMSYAGRAGAVVLVRCKLPVDAQVYRGADGTLRDLPSNQPFWPVMWDASPPLQQRGEPGPAPTEAQVLAAVAMYCAAHDGCRGQQGLDFVPSASKSWCGTTCRWLVGSAIVGGIFIAVGEHNNWWRSLDPVEEEGVPPGGSTGPAFSIFGLPFRLGG